MAEMALSGVFGTTMHDEDSLDDMGFFSFAKTNAFASDDAQQALNELGLVPSPPRRNLYEHHNEDDRSSVPFDLEHELELERMQAQEESSQPTPYDLEEDEEPLEDTGVLDADSSPVLTPTNSTTTTLRSFSATKAEASSSKKTLTDSRVHEQPRIQYENDDDDLLLGVNGIPKYIPAGVTHVTLLDGTVMRLERRKRANAWRPKPAHYGARATGLLSRPVYRIIEEIEAMNALAVVRQNEAQASAVSRLIRPRKIDAEMWQERYRPARFTELIGEERSHRDVMSWLKSWDACVFGKRNAHSRKRFRDQDSAPVVDGQPFFRDKWDRPRERILLLGGPAGMGKTTLAHVAARTSGYRVHEINASDDRSAKTVEERVRHALESNSLHGNQTKQQPTCLILDEVDGATGSGAESSGTSFVRALIKLVENGGTSSTTQAGTGSKRKGGKKHRPLLRPIICVCNDPYAPALRALRPYSKLVRLNRPSTPALMARLRQICEREEIAHDSAGLNMLVGLCQGDVRSCLNALQLVQSDPRGVTVAAIEGSGGDTVGPDKMSLASALSIKDGSSSIHQTWMKLFRTQTSKERDRRSAERVRAKNAGRGGGDDGEGLSSELNDVVNCIMSGGEMDKVLSGCFEHYTNLKLVDDGWWRFRKMHDWIHWYEYLNRRGWEIGAHTELWSYLPWSFAGWRLLFANTANELPEYPRIDYQNHLKRTAFDEMAADTQNNLPATTRVLFDKEALVCELGPMLVPLLTPNLKPINSQLVRTDEKQTLNACVTLMHGLNIDFVMDKNAQGHTFYRFDPPLEAFAHFEGKRVEGNAGNAARFNVRQLLSTELRSYRLRLTQEAAKSKTKDGKGDSKEQGNETKGKSDAGVPKKRVALDFFGRPIVAKPKVSLQTAAVTLPESILAKRQEKENDAPSETTAEESVTKKAKLKVFYHYHEGYSNAVRKPIKMSALLS